MREARRPGLDGLARENGVVALDGIDTRSLVLHLRDRGAMWAGDRRPRRRGRRGPHGRRWRARRSSPASRRPSRTARRGRPRRASRSSTTGQALDPAPAAGAGAAVTSIRTRRRRRHARRLRRRRPARNGPGDPDPLVEETARRPGPARPHAGASAICLGHQLLGARHRPRDLQAPVRPPRREPPGRSTREPRRVLVTSQNHGFAVRRPSDAEATRDRRSTTAPSRGFDFPDLRARSVQFHPEAGPGPHDGWPLIESWVEELRAADELTSSRSA